MHRERFKNHKLYYFLFDYLWRVDVGNTKQTNTFTAVISLPIPIAYTHIKGSALSVPTAAASAFRVNDYCTIGHHTDQQKDHLAATSEDGFELDSL